MKELTAILEKYENVDFENISDRQKSIESISIDIIEICKKIILLGKIDEEDKTDINQGTVIGLIVKCLKLHESIFELYKLDKWEIIKILDRSFYEAFIVAQHLMNEGITSQINFRKISYKNYIKTQEIFKETNQDQTKTARTQLEQTKKALEIDDFTMEEVEQYGKDSKWKLDKKSFFDIHFPIKGKELYYIIYGLDSDITHGNWREILHFHVIQNDDKSFHPKLSYHTMQPESLCSNNNMLIDLMSAYLEWRKFEIPEIDSVLKKIRSYNRKISLQMI